MRVSLRFEALAFALLCLGLTRPELAYSHVCSLFDQLSTPQRKAIAKIRKLSRTQQENAVDFFWSKKDYETAGEIYLMLGNKMAAAEAFSSVPHRYEEAFRLLYSVEKKSVIPRLAIYFSQMPTELKLKFEHERQAMLKKLHEELASKRKTASASAHLFEMLGEPEIAVDLFHKVLRDGGSFSESSYLRALATLKDADPELFKIKIKELFSLTETKELFLWAPWFQAMHKLSVEGPFEESLVAQSKRYPATVTNLIEWYNFSGRADLAFAIAKNALQNHNEAVPKEVFARYAADAALADGHYKVASESYLEASDYAHAIAALAKAAEANPSLKQQLKELEGRYHRFEFSLDFNFSTDVVHSLTVGKYLSNAGDATKALDALKIPYTIEYGFDAMSYSLRSAEASPVSHALLEVYQIPSVFNFPNAMSDSDLALTNLRFADMFRVLSNRGYKVVVDPALSNESGIRVYLSTGRKIFALAHDAKMAEVSTVFLQLKSDSDRATFAVTADQKIRRIQSSDPPWPNEIRLNPDFSNGPTKGWGSSISLTEITERKQKVKAKLKKHKVKTREIYRRLPYIVEALTDQKTELEKDALSSALVLHEVVEAPKPTKSFSKKTPFFLHPDFADKLRTLHERGISVAIDPSLTLGSNRYAGYYDGTTRMIGMNADQSFSVFEHEFDHAIRNDAIIRSGLSYEVLLELADVQADSLLYRSLVPHVSSTDREAIERVGRLRANTALPYRAVDETLAVDAEMLRMSPKETVDRLRARYYALTWQIHEVSSIPSGKRNSKQKKSLRKAVAEAVLIHKKLESSDIHLAMAPELIEYFRWQNQKLLRWVKMGNVGAAFFYSGVLLDDDSSDSPQRRTPRMSEQEIDQAFEKLIPFFLKDLAYENSP